MVNWFRKAYLEVDDLNNWISEITADPKTYTAEEILSYAQDIASKVTSYFRYPNSRKRSVSDADLLDFWQKLKALYMERDGDEASFPEIVPPSTYTVGPSE